MDRRNTHKFEGGMESGGGPASVLLYHVELHHVKLYLAGLNLGLGGRRTDVLIDKVVFARGGHADMKCWEAKPALNDKIHRFHVHSIYSKETQFTF